MLLIFKEKTNLLSELKVLVSSSSGSMESTSGDYTSATRTSGTQSSAINTGSGESKTELLDVYGEVAAEAADVHDEVVPEALGVHDEFSDVVANAAYVQIVASNGIQTINFNISLYIPRSK